MMLFEFENMLKNLANDRALMQYGNNYNVVNGLLSVVSLAQSLSGIVQSDRTNDMFSMSVGNKVKELESTIAMFGNQRLMACGINAGNMGGGMQPFSPYGPAMYNQPMMYPNMMGGMMPQYNQGYNPMMQPQQMQQMQQMPQMQQQMPPQQPMFNQAPPVPQQQAPAAAYSPPPPPSNAPEMSTPAPVQTPAAATPPPPPVKNDSPPVNAGGGDSAAKAKAPSFSLPGMGGGGDDKAAGRDYLLKLLEDK